MNYYLASQLAAERQAALAANPTHRAQIKDARTAHKARPVADQPVRTRRFYLGRLAHATA